MIERCFDYRIVKRYLGVVPAVSSEIYYLEEKGVGMWTVFKYKEGVQIHADLTKECRGNAAVSSGMDVLRWLKKNTKAKTFYALVPKYNQAAGRIAISCGLTRSKEIEEGFTVYEVSNG